MDVEEEVERLLAEGVVDGVAAGRCDEEPRRRVDDERVVGGAVLRVSAGAQTAVNSASSAAKAVALLYTSGRNAEKSMKSDVSKIDVIESVNGIGSSRSSKSFRPCVSYSDLSVKMRSLRSRLFHLWRRSRKQTAGLISCTNVTKSVNTVNCGRTSVVALSSR